MRLAEQPSVRFAASDFAPRPAEWRGIARDEVRLLIGTKTDIRHARFSDLPDFLRAGDVLVINNSATLAGEIDGMIGDESVVLHLGARLDGGDRVVELRKTPDAARTLLDARPGDAIEVGRGEARFTLGEPWPTGQSSSPTGVGNRLWRARVDGDLDKVVARDGRPIAYGYLDQRYPLAAYQTVFGHRPGSAEMASAGRPFTPELVAALVSRGVGFAPVTLHAGLSSQEAGEAPGPEWFEVSEASARQINSARDGGGRIIAVGTTATRAIESSVSAGDVLAGTGWTERVITPAAPPHVVDGLITGWHDPLASHLLLVEAVAGRALAQSAYDAAVAEGYLWHEFGDSALLLGGR